MSKDTCPEMHLLVQADVDGELSAAEAARVAEHLQDCADCAELPAKLSSLSARIKQEVRYHAAPEALRSAIRAQVASRAAPEPARIAPTRPSWRTNMSRLRFRTAAPFGAGFALAACLVLALGLPRSGGLPDEVVADHIRALQPGHLMDVISTDQHTVKPWFDGRLDFAPPVKDLQPQGFPLVGGRLDYLGGRPVAALVYQRRQHVIDVYIWPDHGKATPVSTSVNGYNVTSWRKDDMVFWAVSDLGLVELTEFVRDLKAD